MIRKALAADLEEITSLAKIVRENMLKSGLNQWLGDYPAYNDFYRDFKNDALYIKVIEDKIIGSISILPENDPAYLEVSWQSDKALVVHRVLVEPSLQGKGIGQELINHSFSLAKEKGYEAVKIDTHPDNLKMQKMLKSLNFVYRGYLSSINRLAYELVI